jgi:hypothetical protein
MKNRIILDRKGLWRNLDGLDPIIPEAGDLVYMGGPTVKQSQTRLEEVGLMAMNPADGSVYWPIEPTHPDDEPVMTMEDYLESESYRKADAMAMRSETTYDRYAQFREGVS